MSGNGRVTQRIRDPVHGLIVFGGGGDLKQRETDHIAWRLVNTREFQRLRRIRQLGFSDLVYPGATHSRLAHSIGVYHVARRLIEVIRSQQDAPNEAEGRARVVLLAALLHDIGHGPFSHVFEHSSHSKKRHEDWSAEIVQGDTDVNKVLREVDQSLPEQIAAMLKEETPKDMYSTVVASQFDADRLDYLQRDRQLTGVEFGHLDYEWLLDCIEEESIVIEGGIKVPCLCLNFKGVQVAEEYLQARFHLYRMVYMHKTTRAAERMLDSLFDHVKSDLAGQRIARTDPVLQYVVSESVSLGAYLDLDDAAVWSTLAALDQLSSPDSLALELAQRLRQRRLYKCLDIGIHDQRGENLYNRLVHRLSECYGDFGALLFDDATVSLYKWYDFADSSALNKVLVKEGPDASSPKDIAKVSSIIPALRDAEEIQRVYASDEGQIVEIRKIMKEVKDDG